MIESSGAGVFRILGPLEVWTGDEWAGIGAPKWRALLALLLLRAGQPVATDQLIDGLWPDEPPARAGNLVSVYVHRLRRLIGDEGGAVLLTRAPGYQVVVRPGDLDADRFAGLVADGRQALAGSDPDRAADLLAAALGLWRGPALADVPPSPPVTAEAERLEESRTAALELRIEADLACGRGGDVAPELRRLLADHPLRERFWALLMRALRGLGRQAEALEAYAQARELIAGELGVDPGPELRRLHEEILRGDAAGAAGRGGPGPGAAGPGEPRMGTPGLSMPPPGTPAPATSGPPTPRPPTPGPGAPGPGTAGRTVPETGAPGQMVPGQIVPGRTAPGQTVQGQTVQGQTAPGTGPSQTVQGQTVPGQTVPETEVGPPATSEMPGPVPLRPGPAASRPEAFGASATGTPGIPAGPGPAPRPGPAQLPADIADFTGRADRVAELSRLLSAAQREGSPGAVPVVLVVGSGGLGKTALAVHAAHLLAREYPHGQLYASLLGATQPADPAEVLGRFLRDLGANPAQIPVGTEERAAQFRTFVSGRRVLVVLDDARDAAQVRPLLPGSASCAVLITARGRLPELVGSKVIDLDVLPPDEARTLFGRVAGEERASAEPEATHKVLAACAGLPLAIRIAGSRLAARGGWNVHYLADRLSDERRRLDELQTGNLAVRASFEVSFASLSEWDRPGGVDPTRAFRLLGVWTGPSISLPGAAALLGASEPDAEEVLEVLVDAHLLDSPSPDRYRFHDLLRVYAADRARAQESEADRADAITRLLTWYLHSTEAAARVISPNRTRPPLSALPPGVRPLSFTSLEEALAWCEAERAALRAAVRLAAASNLNDIAWELPAAAMSFYYRRSHWTDWVTTHEIGLASARAEGDRAAEAWLLNNLGMVFGQQRRPEAAGCFERALELFSQLGDLPGRARSANNVATSYFDLGRFEEARRAGETSLALQREMGSRFGEGIALGLLGGAYRELGRVPDAIATLREALVIYTELGDRDGEADALSDLGEAYLQAGQVTQAVQRLKESLAIRRAVGDRHGEAATLHRLGLARQQDGDAAAAHALLTEAVDLFEELGDTARSAQARHALASVVPDGDDVGGHVA